MLLFSVVHIFLKKTVKQSISSFSIIWFLNTEQEITEISFKTEKTQIPKKNSKLKSPKTEINLERIQTQNWTEDQKKKKEWKYPKKSRPKKTKSNSTKTISKRSIKKQEQSIIQDLEQWEWLFEFWNYSLLYYEYCLFWMVERLM